MDDKQASVQKMNRTTDLRFERDVELNKWEKFCTSNGLSFAPNIGQNFNVFVGRNIEISLNKAGDTTEGYPPLYFDGMDIVYTNDPDTVRLIRKIAETFDSEVYGLVSDQETKQEVENLKERIRSDLSRFVFEKVSPSSESEIRKALNDSLRETPGIHHYNVSHVKSIIVTWEDLYPRRWCRLKAKFARNVLRAPTLFTCRPSRLMRWFGYKSDQIVSVRSDTFYSTLFETEDIVKGIENALAEGSLRIKTVSRLPVPYSKLAADVSFTPILPVDSIDIKINI